MTQQAAQQQDNLYPTRTLAVPAYLPERIAAQVAGKRLLVELPRGARRRVRTAEKILPSTWNERHRRVPAGEASPGPWRREYAPHAPIILDLMAQPFVREFWYCGPERDGKTNILTGYAAWSIDSRPGNIYYLMPSEEKAKQIVSEKIRPLLEESPRLARYLGENKRIDITQTLIRLNNGVRIFPAHARSATSLASFSALIGIGDEVDKYDETVGKETDAITLLRKRLREHQHRSKLLLASTPAGKFVHRGALACQQVLVTELQCHACHGYHRAGEEGLILPEGATVASLQSGDQVPQQACPLCGALWDKSDLDFARRHFRLVAIKGADKARPSTVGLLRSAWDCIHVPLVEIAVAKLKAEADGDLAAKRDYAHGYRCEDYVEDEITAPMLDGLAERRESYAPVVPMTAGLLTAGVDVQADRLEIEVVAWGVGAESWGIEYAVLYGDTSLPEVWTQLDTFLMRRWRHECGEELPLSRVFIDEGFRTHMVVRFTAPRLGRGIWSAKGSSEVRAPEIMGPTRSKVGGVRLQHYVLGTQRLKTTMFGYFGLETPGPGYCHVPDSYEVKWFEMLKAEHLVTKRVSGREVASWEKVKPSARNEAIDCRVYSLAAFLSLRVDMKARVAELKAKAVQQTEKVVNRAPAKRPGGFVTGWKQ